ncbi:MAG: SMI1/KNR4 family protein [Microbacteriaceae bacterium]
MVTTTYGTVRGLAHRIFDHLDTFPAIGFNLPASRQDLQEIAELLEAPIDVQLLELISLGDGETQKSPGLLYGLKLLTTAQIQALLLSNQALVGWLPFAADNQGRLLGVRLSDDDSTPGAVTAVLQNGGKEYPVAENIAELLSAVASSLEVREGYPEVLRLRSADAWSAPYFFGMNNGSDRPVGFLEILDTITFPLGSGGTRGAKVDPTNPLGSNYVPPIGASSDFGANNPIGELPSVSEQPIGKVQEISSHPIGELAAEPQSSLGVAAASAAGVIGTTAAVGAGIVGSAAAASAQPTSASQQHSIPTPHIAATPLPSPASPNIPAATPAQKPTSAAPAAVPAPAATPAAVPAAVPAAAQANTAPATKSSSESLVIEQADAKALAALANIPALRNLKLPDLTPIIDEIGALGNLKKLKSLSVASAYQPVLNELKKLQNLEDLELRNSLFYALNFLKSLPQLSSLKFVDTTIQDASVLGDLSGLRTLNLQNTLVEKGFQAIINNPSIQNFTGTPEQMRLFTQARAAQNR